MNKNEFPIVIDLDPALQFEINSPIKKIFNYLLIPVLNAIPAQFQKLIKKSNKSAKDVIENATTHAAIEILYHRGYPNRSKKLIQRFFHSIWFNTNNSKAVRNRLKIVKRELRNYIAPQQNVSILSIAAGSARGIIEILSEFQNSEKRISAVFLDKNPAAIEYSRHLSKHLTSFNFEWVTDTVSNFFRNSSKKFNIVEIVGLMDYFEDDKALETFKYIYESLETDGIMITANIRDNSERKFVSKAIGWKMIYRSPEELGDLVLRAGFKSANIKIYSEPLKIHTVVIAKK